MSRWIDARINNFVPSIIDGTPAIMTKIEIEALFDGLDNKQIAVIIQEMASRLGISDINIGVVSYAGR